MRRVETRLRKLEGVSSEYADILTLIRQGRFYDELTPQQPRRYCLYRYGMDHHPEIEISRLFDYPFDTHFQLERKPPPPTEKELAAIVAEVEQIMNDISKATH